MKRDISHPMVWRLLPMYILMYMAQSIYQNFMPMYLDTVGFDSMRRGILLALPNIVAIAAQPVMGTISDRAKTKNRVQICLFLAAAVFLLLHRVNTSFLYVALIMAMYAFVQNPALPLTDAISLESLSAKGLRFGPVRFGGTIGFMISALACGTVAGDSPDKLFVIGAALLLISAAYCFVLPRVKGGGRKGQKVSVWAVLKIKGIPPVLLLGLIYGSCLGFYYAFYPNFLISKGGTGTMVGIAMALAACLEFIFLFNNRKIQAKMGGAANLLMSVGVMLSLRWLLYGLVDSPVALMLFQLMHGWGFVAMSVTLAEHVNGKVPEELKATGQMLVALVITNIGRTVGALAGGWANRFLPYDSIFLILSGICLGATAIYFVWERLGKKWKKV